jgi:hypothetical protein
LDPTAGIGGTMPSLMAGIWERRYWLLPLALVILLVVFLVQQLWIDSVIVGVFLAGFLGFLAVVAGYERSVFDKIKQGQPEDGE